LYETLTTQTSVRRPSSDDVELSAVMVLTLLDGDGLGPGGLGQRSL
jgi:hypothetical protein